MKPAREWANDRQLAYDVSDLESEKFYSEIQRDAQAELRSEIERLREALDAAENVVELGGGLLSRLEALGGANCVDADEMALLRDALAEYDKLKEVE